MIRKLSIAAGLAVAMTFALSGQNASAVTVGPHTVIPNPAVSDGSLIHNVQWGPHCHRWARICAHRWGWRTWRFRRCMRHHGC
jgi:hypothetical protein